MKEHIQAAPIDRAAADQQALQQELIRANEKMQDIINAIPGGVAIYKVTDIFETVYFSDGVPELSGYTVEEYRKLAKQDAAKMTYWEDTPKVVAKVRKVIETHQVVTFEFRKQHRDGHIVWVRVQMKWIGEEDGCPLLHCVFHNISDLKDAQLEMSHLVNSIPGGIASYRVEGERLVPIFFSDGVMGLSGHTRQEFAELVKDDALSIICEADRPRVLAATRAALESGGVLDISYRMRHKGGSLIWIHLNGRRLDPLGEGTRFYAVFTGMSAETRLFQGIANETADAIYVIDKETYDLLYVNETKALFRQGDAQVGQKCYAALHGKTAPCEFCTLKTHAPDGKAHAMDVGEKGCFYRTRFRETEWNGIPSYVKYVEDVTEEVRTQREKERLEQYFQTMVKNLPGGIAVVRYEQDGSMTPEFLSDGFAEMTGMTVQQVWDLYRQDAMAGVHPDDQEGVAAHMAAFVASGDSQCEIVYRLKKGDEGYIWVKNTLSIIQNEGGEIRVYAGYHDITREKNEQALLRRQYNELIMQHYREPGPNALVIGHCNITQNKILEIEDRTGSDLLKTFGTMRESFFAGIASLVVERDERQAFLGTYLNEPSLAAFREGRTQLVQDCYIKLPKEERGRYARFKVSLVEAPGTGDITGILTVTDITEQTISGRIQRQLSVASYDLVADVDLWQDRYLILTADKNGVDVPRRQGRHSERVAYMLRHQVLPKDREHVAQMLNNAYIFRRLEKEGSYSFSYAIQSQTGEVLTKNLTVSAADLRLGRVCLARADITDSVREQQSLLNVIAYTFELLAFIHVDMRRLTLYTRQTVLESLPPLVVENYSDSSVHTLAEFYEPGQDRAAVEDKFRIATMVKRLEQQPAGYDFVLPYKDEKGLRYKQINVLWGDGAHKTVCMVRADVTDMLAAERQSKSALEQALALAEEANRAKSDFLSSMSHDIRTPMNAIMGMTALAAAHLDDRDRVQDALQKISFSSKHLLSLINDILDMSKIERGKLSLNKVKLCLPELVQQVGMMLTPQADTAGLAFKVHTTQIEHPYFYGDPLRINQILINLLGNALKFTPEGGKVEFLVQELPPRVDTAHVRYRFTISDTGIGMTEAFTAHLFEPFTRSESATNVEGTGLGLSITKGLVDLMDGTISVESRIHQGTTFCVELECEAAQDGAGAAPAGEAQPLTTEGLALTGRRFLVAEDNAINAEILCELLQMYGAGSHVEMNGAQAVQAFCEAEPGTYDAVLMDIQMPVMNGYEAARAIRALERPDAKTIPIIAMTANAFSEDIQASREAGMNAHVAKPIDVQLLYTALHKALGGV